MAHLKDLFVKEVKDMRRLQVEYFRARSPYILKEAKKKELVVDKLIIELSKIN
jgi:hypothetical protein